MGKAEGKYKYSHIFIYICEGSHIDIKNLFVYEYSRIFMYINLYMDH
jgi:hypothetical protein